MALSKSSVVRDKVAVERQTISIDDTLKWCKSVTSSNEEEEEEANKSEGKASKNQPSVHDGRRKQPMTTEK